MEKQNPFLFFLSTMCGYVVYILAFEQFRGYSVDFSSVSAELRVEKYSLSVISAWNRLRQAEVGEDELLSFKRHSLVESTVSSVSLL